MIILIGEGGGGKTTILNELAERGFEKAVNYTTRPKRNEEKEVAEYEFITKEKFDEMWEEGKLIQRAEFNNEYYGVSINSLKDNVACISIVESIKDIRERIKELEIKNVNLVTFYIYLNEEERRKRMIERGDSKEDIEKRLSKDREVFLNAKEVVDYTMENNDSKITVEEIINILKTAR